jgi:hypothetical protein
MLVARATVELGVEISRAGYLAEHIGREISARASRRREVAQKMKRAGSRYSIAVRRKRSKPAQDVAGSCGA